MGKRLTLDQEMLLDALKQGSVELGPSAWLDCAADTYRTACSLVRRGLICIHGERGALGDYRAQLAN